MSRTWLARRQTLIPLGKSTWNRSFRFRSTVVRNQCPVLVETMASTRLVTGVAFAFRGAATVMATDPEDDFLAEPFLPFLAFTMMTPPRIARKGAMTTKKPQKLQKFSTYLSFCFGRYWPKRVKLPQNSQQDLCTLYTKLY